MGNAGLEPLIFSGINTVEKMEELLAQWSNLSQTTETTKGIRQMAQATPTAIFSTKRLTSVRLIQALHRRNIRVPEDMAVLGFDDFELAEVLGTPLTVVRQSPSDVARAAAELLFRKIATVENGHAVDQQAAKTVFPTTLILRRSCGCTF
jgi:LacI family transcriptional regulator